MTGTGDGINHYLFSNYGVSLILSLLMVILGLCLSGVSLFFQSAKHHGRLLLWPALLTLSVGVWKFCGNMQVLYIAQQSAPLQLLSFAGMYALPIPLVLFIQQFSDGGSSAVLTWMRRFLEAFLLAALALQLAGRVHFTQSMFVFHAMVPIIVSILIIYLIRLLRRGSRQAGYLLFAIFVLGIASLAELIDYYCAYVDGNLNSPFFQVGFMIFAIAILVGACVYLRSLLHTQQKARQLEQEMLVLERSIAVQEERSQMLSTYQEQLRQQRHDLRHHLRTIRQLLTDGDDAQAAAYIDTLETNIPEQPLVSYCDNIAVSALLTYYTARAKILGIRLTMDVSVPASSEAISDAHLCVLFGNLIENAGEACKRMTYGDKFIDLSAQVHGGILFISMDNSFSGQYARSSSGFISSKRPELGTGLQSVRTLAAEHGGAAKFTPMGEVFRSEVYVKI